LVVVVVDVSLGVNTVAVSGAGSDDEAIARSSDLDRGRVASAAEP
jgi:hypothetical protein